MHIYKLIRNEKISETTQLITLKNDEQGRPFGFQPGQYAAISFWHKGRQTPARCFSIVSSPTDQEILQFSLRVNGHFTKAVEDIKPDDPVKVYGPFGGFIFNTVHDKDVIMLAGGIGITPFISMIRYISRLETSNKVVLLYSCRSADDIPFADELLQHAYQNSNFQVLFIIGNNNIQKLPKKHALGGRITPALLDEVTGKSYGDRKFFICGPPPFMGGLTATLLSKGVSKRNIMTESFSQASHPQSGILKSWPANVYALSALSVVLGSFFVTVNDLIKNYQTTTAAAQAVTAPYLITNARQQQIDQLVNSIPISANVVISPTANQANQATQNAPSATVPLSSTAPSVAPSYHASGTTPSTAIATPSAPSSSTSTPAPTTTSTPTPTPTLPPVTSPTSKGSGGKTGASSDRRLKENIRYLARVTDGLRLYSFNYKGKTERWVGIMAQDIAKSHPDAIDVDSNGYYLVDYSSLGLRMALQTEWQQNQDIVYL